MSWPRRHSAPPSAAGQLMAMASWWLLRCDMGLTLNDAAYKIWNILFKINDNSLVISCFNTKCI